MDRKAHSLKICRMAPNGYSVRPCGQKRAKEKAEENQTKSLMGNEGTMFARPSNPNAHSATKMVIQHSDDLLKGQFANGTADVIEE